MARSSLSFYFKGTIVMSSGVSIHTLSPNTSKSVQSGEKVTWSTTLGSISLTGRLKKPLSLRSSCCPAFLALGEW